MGDTEELIPEGVAEKALSILQDKQALGKQMGGGEAGSREGGRLSSQRKLKCSKAYTEKQNSKVCLSETKQLVCMNLCLHICKEGGKEFIQFYQ